MKRSLAFIALFSGLASFTAFADTTPSTPAAAHYEYGMPLDIAKVISITPASNDADCQVGTAHMVYVDHQGQTREVDYRQMGNCSQL
ncbi:MULTISPECIES: DUF2790 domain-containing protein [unclassified Pseudomonas]|uniref:DUF2790 domain-containing protein n=1 Tax=unclassified Pseudomonas TaxID=196821 RepID=UPI00244AFBA9|nr:MULTISPECIES: DUF2790 domain-containing protein [unclassified Pseudomonas]MDH0301938.1 DUF2790 domain-containing protein [Pseudomonas sp. GD04091]MDH1983774.1 DUF2790 domain-containing protein [Pseudomonas sp. GD03689]